MGVGDKRQEMVGKERLDSLSLYQANLCCHAGIQISREWNSTLQGLAYQTPLVVNTLILPPGVALTDPRLTHVQPVATRTYCLQPGQFFQCPSESYVVDIDKSLTASTRDSVQNQKGVRYQILHSEKKFY